MQYNQRAQHLVMGCGTVQVKMSNNRKFLSAKGEERHQMMSGLLETRFAPFEPNFSDVITGKKGVQPIQPSAEQPRRTPGDDVTPMLCCRPTPKSGLK